MTRRLGTSKSSPIHLKRRESGVFVSDSSFQPFAPDAAVTKCEGTIGSVSPSRFEQETDDGCTETHHPHAQALHKALGQVVGQVVRLVHSHARACRNPRPWCFQPVGNLAAQEPASRDHSPVPAPRFQAEHTVICENRAKGDRHQQSTRKQGPENKAWSKDYGAAVGPVPRPSAPVMAPAPQKPVQQAAIQTATPPRPTNQVVVSPPAAALRSMPPRGVNTPASSPSVIYAKARLTIHKNAWDKSPSIGVVEKAVRCAPMERPDAGIA